MVGATSQLDVKCPECYKITIVFSHAQIIWALALNSELFGVKSSCGLGIDAMIPETSVQFDELSKAVVEKVQLFPSSTHYYNDFVENLIKK